MVKLISVGLKIISVVLLRVTLLSIQLRAGTPELKKYIILSSYFAPKQLSVTPHHHKKPPPPLQLKSL
jgi:hypothetical protein